MDEKYHVLAPFLDTNGDKINLISTIPDSSFEFASSNFPYLSTLVSVDYETACQWLCNAKGIESEARYYGVNRFGSVYANYWRISNFTAKKVITPIEILNLETEINLNFSPWGMYKLYDIVEGPRQGTGGGPPATYGVNIYREFIGPTMMHRGQFYFTTSATYYYSGWKSVNLTVNLEKITLFLVRSDDLEITYELRITDTFF